LSSEIKDVFFCFPCDGAGTGARICEEYRQSYASGDLCPRGPEVQLEEFAVTIKRSPPDALIVMSFAMKYLSPVDLQILHNRDVVCIDRHRCDHWNIMTADNVVSGTVNLHGDDQIVAHRDNMSEVPKPYLPLFLNNKRATYVSKLERDDLTSLLRFLKLHKWDSRLVVDDAYAELLKAYGFERVGGGRFNDTISNTPFHSIDFYNGVSYRDRLVVQGIPYECNLNHVLCLSEQPKPPTISILRDGKYYIRFKEAGEYQLQVHNRSYRVVVKEKVKVNWGKRKDESVVEMRSAFGPCTVSSGIDICDIEMPLTPNEVLFYRAVLDLDV